LDDNYNIPVAWMPDSREVIFSSQRATNRLMYRQSLDPGSSAELITSGGNANFYLARLSPDRASILLEGAPDGTHKMGIYRVGLAGGVPQRLFDTGGFVLFWCSDKAANFCLFGKPSANKSELVVVGFDPDRGPGAELARIPLEAGTSADIGFDYTWQLSPDGSRISIVKRHGNLIRLVPLRGGKPTTIAVKGFPDLLDMNWAIDSKSMFVSTVRSGGSILLRVSPNGEAQPIWQQHQSKLTWGISSPDGRHLAIIGPSSEANVWMIGNF
jgi:hypothetical protein